MPIITPLQPLKLELKDGEFQPMGTGRAPGMHMSEIVRAMMEADKMNVGGIEGEEPEVRPQAGFWWEAALAWAMMQQANAEYRGIIWQPKLMLDAVHISPDGFDVPHNRFVSVKLTWKSMRKWEEDAERYFWPWFVHDMAAMLAMNRLPDAVRPYMQAGAIAPVTTIRYYHFWTNGDYSRKPGRGAQTTYSDVTFSIAEQEANWKTALRYRDWVLKRREEAASNV